MNIGIVGAGFVGQTIAKLAKRAGHHVKICNSRDPRTLFTFSLVEKVEVGTVEEVASFAEVIVLAIPFYAYSSLNKDLFKDKIVIDTTNYYPDRDGHVALLDQGQTTVSELIASYLDQVKLVKAFNSIKMEDLLQHSFPENTAQKLALPLSGDDLNAKAIAHQLYTEFGYDTVDAGALAEGWRFERGMPVYCVLLNQSELYQNLIQTQRN